MKYPKIFFLNLFIASKVTFAFIDGHCGHRKSILYIYALLQRSRSDNPNPLMAEIPGSLPGYPVNIKNDISIIYYNLGFLGPALELFVVL